MAKELKDALAQLAVKRQQYNEKKGRLDKKLEEMKELSAQVNQNPNNNELYQKLMNLINNDIANLTEEVALFGMGLGGEAPEFSSDTDQ